MSYQTRKRSPGRSSVLPPPANFLLPTRFLSRYVLPTVLFVCLLGYFSLLPPPLQNVISRFDTKPVDEIYGLLYFVTRPPGPSGLPLLTGIDPTQPVDWAVYAGDENVDWNKYARSVRSEAPLVVFSKTYCPHSRAAKNLLESYALSPAPTVVEVDLRDDADVIKIILGRLTGRATFPNVLLHGKSIGGNDDIQAAARAKTLKKTLRSAGINMPMKKKPVK